MGVINIEFGFILGYIIFVVLILKSVGSDVLELKRRFFGLVESLLYFISFLYYKFGDLVCFGFVFI